MREELQLLIEETCMIYTTGASHFDHQLPTGTVVGRGQYHQADMARETKTVGLFICRYLPIQEDSIEVHQRVITDMLIL